MKLLDAVRAGCNTACVDCGAAPFGGGLRCLGCFQHRAQHRPPILGHTCTKHQPSTACYITCRCRCDECSHEKAVYAKAKR